VRERDVEQKLVKAVRARGGMCAKWVSPGLDGVPDRIVLLPEGKIGFVELKAPGERPRPLQIARMEQIKRLGHKCFVCGDPGLIDGILEEIDKGGE
jgi:VRR-NUC domain.